MNIERRVKELEKSAGIHGEHESILYVEFVSPDHSEMLATDEVKDVIKKEISRQRAEGQKYIVVLVPVGYYL